MHHTVGGYKDLSRVYYKNDKVVFHGFCEISFGYILKQFSHFLV